MLENQLTIFDWCPNLEVMQLDDKPLKKISLEPRAKLSNGQHVFYVKQADIKEYEINSCRYVQDQFFYTGTTDDKTHNVFPEKAIGKTLFLDLQQAQMAVAEFFKKNHNRIITAKELETAVQDYEVYTYRIKHDEKIRYMFLCKVDDMTYYVKGAFQFKHIVRFQSNREKEKFMQEFQEDKKLYHAEISQDPPEYVNLYECEASSSWAYSEKGYSGIVSELREGSFYEIVQKK